MRRKRQAQKWQQIKHEQSAAANRVADVVRSLNLGGDVQPDVARTGRVTLRCTLCGKVCYRDRECAEQAVAKIPDPMTAYLSEACGWWHLATQRPQRGAQP